MSFDRLTPISIFRLRARLLKMNGWSHASRHVALGVDFDRVVGGRIVEHGGTANVLEPLPEIGAVKVVGPLKKRYAEQSVA